ncbi:hypothetical protein [Leptolyngbya ohadii]|uniref:hypothetical protein n=1 Tax=Leptolyngbya ohadii TaxID=1962290 RepID=UPI000B59BC4B|nr:hypothetical protein [Leptolyngbya ohadii]
MTAQILTLEQFIQEHPLLYRKFCFWAGKRGVEDAPAEVRDYLTDLIVEASTAQDDSEVLVRWTARLSLQERNALAYLSRVPIGDSQFAKQWYGLENGEYSVADEPIVHEISHDGQPQGIVTRNRYDCLVLNCDSMMIVDVDICAPEHEETQDCARNSQVALSQKQAIAAVENLAEQFSHLGFRVYRTRNGLRHLCVTQPFDPQDTATHRLMANLYVDPLYARLCQFQATFRARLTPKPWRVDDEYRQKFIYDRITGAVIPESSRYAVCHLIEIIGEPEILPEFEPLVQIHDSYCRVSRLGLELA